MTPEVQSSTSIAALVLRGFATPHDVTCLKQSASGVGTWKQGRSGFYHRTPPRRPSEVAEGTKLAEQALRLCAEAGGATLTLARVPTGGWVSAHVDDQPEVISQVTLCLRLADEGGEFLVGGQPCNLGPGDAIFFDANAVRHEVLPVKKGSALFALFQMGKRLRR